MAPTFIAALSLDTPRQDWSFLAPLLGWIVSLILIKWIISWGVLAALRKHHRETARERNHHTTQIIAAIRAGPREEPQQQEWTE